MIQIVFIEFSVKLGMSPNACLCNQGSEADPFFFFEKADLIPFIRELPTVIRGT